MLHDPGHAVLAAARRAARDADAPLLLAVSGGLDSMALLHAMAAVARSRIASVATFDHGTGPAAVAAASTVARSAAALGLPVVGGCLHVSEAPVVGREAAWRAARYEFLRSAAAALGARIVTAHTADDHVETVLMRIMRGSGARGLAGLLAPGDVSRPFLALRRATLAAFVRERGIEWRDDPSNRVRHFFRNRIRHDILPALRRADPDIDVALLDTARRAAAWRAEVEAFIDGHVGLRSEGGALVIDRTELQAHDRDSLAVIWGALAGRVGLALDRRGTHRLTAFTTSDPHGGRVPLSGGWSVQASRTSYRLHRLSPDAPGEAALPDDGALRWGRFHFQVTGSDTPALTRDGQARLAWSATLPVGERPVVRRWAPGDRLAPAAGQQRRRVKRYLSEAGVRGPDRRDWPVVVAGDDVVWIPGVRRSNAASERSGRPVRTYVCERIDR